jgi:hypothetical protein
VQLLGWSEQDLGSWRLPAGECFLGQIE